MVGEHFKHASCILGCIRYSSLFIFFYPYFIPIMLTLFGYSSTKSNFTESSNVYPMMNPYPPRHPGSVGSENEYQNREPMYVQQTAPRDLPRPPQATFPPPPPPQQQQQQPPSPTRKSMFDFVSPYDAFSPTSVPAPKKTEATTSTGSRDTDDSWTSVSASDPKRKSVENLMDQLTRSQPMPGITQHQSEYYGSDYGTPMDSPAMQSRAPPAASLPPKLPPSPPRNSPPRALPQENLKPRAGESPQITGLPITGAGSGFLAGREKADSPPLRGGWKNSQDSKTRGPQPKGRSFLTLGYVVDLIE